MTSSNSYLSFYFIASFAFVLQKHRAKPIPLKLGAHKGSPFGRAPATAGEREIVAFIRPLRRLRRHFPQRERRFVTTIITQIGRENKCCLCRNLCVSVGAIHESPVFVLRISAGDSWIAPTKYKHPYENEPKGMLLFYSQTSSTVIDKIMEINVNNPLNGNFSPWQNKIFII